MMRDAVANSKRALGVALAAVIGLGTGTAMGGPPRNSTAAETKLYEAVNFCWDGLYEQPDDEARGQYQEVVAAALKLDPAVKNTKVRLSADDLGDKANNAELKNRTLWQWKLVCDNHYKQGRAWEAKAKASLRGDRKRIVEEEGWPTEPEVNAGHSWAQLLKATSWRYGSMPNRNGENMCWETFYFKGDKVARRKTEGLCH